MKLPTDPGGHDELQALLVMMFVLSLMPRAGCLILLMEEIPNNHLGWC